MTGDLTPAEVVDVVRQTDERENQEEGDPDRGHALVDLTSDSSAAKPFDDREQNVAAVEDGAPVRVVEVDGLTLKVVKTAAPGGGTS